MHLIRSTKQCCCLESVGICFAFLFAFGFGFCPSRIGADPTGEEGKEAQLESSVF